MTCYSLVNSQQKSSELTNKDVCCDGIAARVLLNQLAYVLQALQSGKVVTRRQLTKDVNPVPYAN